MANPVPADTPIVIAPTSTITVTTIATIYQQMRSASTSQSDSQSPQQPKSSGNSSLSRGGYVGIAVSCLAAIAVVGIVLYWAIRQAKAGERRRALGRIYANTQGDGAPGPQSATSQPPDEYPVQESDSDRTHESQSASRQPESQRSAQAPPSAPSSPSTHSTNTGHGMSNQDYPLRKMSSSRTHRTDPATSQQHTNRSRAQAADNRLEDQLAFAEDYQNRRRIDHGGPEESDVALSTAVAESQVARPETGWTKGISHTSDSAFRRSSIQSSRSLQEVEEADEVRYGRRRRDSYGSDDNEGGQLPRMGIREL